MPEVLRRDLVRFPSFPGRRPSALAVAPRPAAPRDPTTGEDAARRRGPLLAAEFTAALRELRAAKARMAQRS